MDNSISRQFTSGSATLASPGSIHSFSSVTVWCQNIIILMLDSRFPRTLFGNCVYEQLFASLYLTFISVVYNGWTDFMEAAFYIIWKYLLTVLWRIFPFTIDSRVLSMHPFGLIVAIPPRPPKRTRTIGSFRSDSVTSSLPPTPGVGQSNSPEFSNRLEDQEWYWGDISRWRMSAHIYNLIHFICYLNYHHLMPQS